MPNPYPEHFPTKERKLRTVIWKLFLEIYAKVKIILGLSHLYLHDRVETTMKSLFRLKVYKPVTSRDLELLEIFKQIYLEIIGK